MVEAHKYEIREGDRLFLRLSKSGKGVYVTNGDAMFGLRGNFDHVKEVLKKNRDYAVLEVRAKQTDIGDKKDELFEIDEESW